MTTTKNGKSDAGVNTPEYSVSELSGAIKKSLEDGFGYVRVRGEVSGYRGPHSSGHCYFSLKDEKSKIDSVVWRGVFSKLKVKPEEGMEVIATGRVTTYAGSSKYQIVVEALEPAGIGALMALLEARKKKLAAEGLFDESRKQPLPFLPRVVGIVTSPTGAVIRDMLHGFDERCPAHVIVWPVRVQGETCAGEVAAAISGFNKLEADSKVLRPDVLIVARGGGSLEDLWGFNEEVVVRAVAASKIPVISAVGHETDWTLIDLVADARAPTPTKAAEWAVPQFSDLVEQTRGLRDRLARSVLRIVKSGRADFKAAVRGLLSREDLFAFSRQRFDNAEKRLAGALRLNAQKHQTRYQRAAERLAPSVIGRGLEASYDRLSSQTGRFGQAYRVLVDRKRRLFEAQSKLLGSLSYQGVLERGFVLVRDVHHVTVRKAQGIAVNTPLELEFSDGRVNVLTTQDSKDRGIEKGRSMSNKATKAAPRSAEADNKVRRAKTKRSDQGSLF